MDIIDWNAVNWGVVGFYGVMAFLTALVANLLNAILGDNRIIGAVLAGVLFAAAFVGWHHYPHGVDLGLPSPGTSSGTTGTSNFNTN